ncbi:MAG: sulfatase, partial [Planctomycetaceae bacterium]|nr:sulfatase [Planctomycetaceae bacterium]
IFIYLVLTGVAETFPFGSDAEAVRGTRPNIIVFIADDLGYADLGCYDAKEIVTPNIDRLAKEGMRFQSFYVAASVCSPSRAAFLTGCYPQRISIPAVFEADSPYGLNNEEQTLPELLKEAGYRTTLFGKWHLGDRPEFLPTRHGFDEFFGTPNSNDMWPRHPVKRVFFPDYGLVEQEKLIEFNPDQALLTKRYTEHALAFLEKNKTKPFFLEIAYNMPHVPLHVTERFRGQSQAGLYGDACMEIDWSVGEIMAALKQHHLEENTIIIFFSDNGPWLSYGNHAGKAVPFRDGKTNSFEGGFRVPCLMRWTGKIPEGRSNLEMVSALDLLPTLCHLAGAPLPQKPIDGKNIWSVMAGIPRVKSPHDRFYYYNGWSLQGVRSGSWKLILPHQCYAVTEPGRDGMPGKHEWQNVPMALYHLENDPKEEYDLSDQEPEVLTRLLGYIAEAREDIGDGIIKVNPEKKDFFQARKLYRMPGKNIRNCGWMQTE